MGEKKHFMAFIYKITNDINQKVYIGKTSFTIEKRWQEHCRDSKKEWFFEKRPLYSAMKKYGIEHFHIEQIEECEEENASNREQYWIGYYKGYEEGYNATRGGDGKISLNYDEIISLLQSGEYPIDIANKLNCSCDSIRQIAVLYNIPIKNKSNDMLRGEKKRAINCYDKQGNFIQSFEAISDAVRWCVQNNICATSNGGARSHISNVCMGKRKSAYGYIWRYRN